MAMSQSRLALAPARKHLIILLLVAFGFFVIVPQLGDFKASLPLVRAFDATWVALSLTAVVASYLFATLTYRCLARRRIVFVELFTIQLAAMFVNRLLPGGIGAVGVNFIYLCKHGHTKASAASVVAVNNSLGFVGHASILSIAAIFYRHDSSVADIDILQRWPYILVAVVLCTLLLRFFGARVRTAMQQFAREIVTYRHEPLRLGAALSSSICLTLCTAASLYAAALSVGVTIDPIVALLVLTAGVGAGVAIPTPGGIGGFEAGMVAALVSFNVAAAPALAVAIMYRIVSYWLPLTIGGGALILSRRYKWL
jgi:glycosyltransferase 2 family protein